MNTCNSCTYWKPKDKKNSHHMENAGKCSCPKFIYSETLYPDPHIATDDCLIYWDMEAYSANFETGKDFGCIHWKER